MGETNAGEQGWMERFAGMFRRHRPETAQSNAVEPCATCGDETVVGSPRWSDRHDVVDERGAAMAYLCGECLAKARAVKGEPLTEDDIRIIAGNGGMIGAGFLGGMH